MDVNPSPSTSLRCFILRRDFLLDHGRIFERYERDFLDTPQPLRTDLEFVAEGRDFVDIQIPPG